MKDIYLFRLLLVFTLITASNSSTIAQNFHLVKDINTSTPSFPSNENFNYFINSGSGQFAVLDSIYYFAADDGIEGKDFWRSDGTSNGTYKLKENVNPTNITISNGKVFFKGSGTVGLWMSDGTEVGTVPLLTQPPTGLPDFIPSSLSDYEGKLFFSVTGHNSFDQLWKTDGTSQGTVLVKDFYNSEVNKTLSGISYLTVVKKKLYFNVLNHSNYANNLAVSNGYSDGTFLISDAATAPAQLISGSSDSADSSVYFTARSITDNDRHRILYVTNGDSGSAKIVPGFNGLTAYLYDRPHLARVGNIIYFIGRAADTTRSESLYEFDPATSEGIKAVKIVAGSNDFGGVSGIDMMTNVDGNLYYNVFDANSNKNQIWKFDGISKENILLKDGLSATNFIQAGGSVYFNGEEKEHGRELWRTDGTINGTAIVADINVGRASSFPENLTSSFGKILFAANDGSHAMELWAVDISNGTTNLVKDINTTRSGSSGPSQLTRLGVTELYFTNYLNDSYSRFFWKSDGTNKGTTVINDTITNIFYPHQDTLTISKKKIFFYGESSSGKRGLYALDVVNGVPTLLKDFSGIAVTMNRIIGSDSLVYFALHNFSSNKNELWRSNGTRENTYVVKDDFPLFYYLNFVSKDNTLFFAEGGNGGLWKTEGTIASTIKVKSIGSEPANFFVHRGFVFFTAGDSNLRTLWKSDGTSAGTIKVTDSIVNPKDFVSVNDKLFFTASLSQSTNKNIGRELFVTDGTTKGTVLVKDIHSGLEETTIYNSIVLNGFLYFFINKTNTNSFELWRSDGTTQGTSFVSEVGSEGEPYTPAELVVSNGKLLFVVSFYLWESDGTKAGTHKVEDSFLTGTTLYSYNNQLTSVGNQVFFIGETYQYGTELYAGYISKPGVTNYFSRTDGNWNDPGTWVGNVVPPEGSGVIIRHTISGNINTTCAELRIEEPGKLTINPGFSVQLMQ